MTSSPPPYRDSTALWRAVADRARTAARADSALTTTGLIREFVFSRFLARVFGGQDDSWVLKGGTAMLARVRTARHSQDLDLFHLHNSTDGALAALRNLAAVDLGDSFRFVVDVRRRRPDTQTQPGVEGMRIGVVAYCGAKKVLEFPIDLVVGAIITDEPETVTPSARLEIPGFTALPYRLYPVVDHIADKLCATVERHGPTQRESTRPRDMIDLVVFARTHTVAANGLWTAIEAERQHRQLPPIPAYVAPASWRVLYPGEARNSAECAAYPTFDSAHALISGFLDPVLARAVSDQLWRPDRGWTR